MRIIYTKENLEFLYGLARSKLPIIESMKSDSLTIEKKKEAWTEISTVFNSKFPENQLTAKQASDKWHAHKKEAKLQPPNKDMR